MSSKFIGQLDAPTGDLAVDRTYAIPGPSGALTARLFDARPERRAGPVVVFFHGGGFVNLDIATHASLCAAIARQLDLPVVSANYRLAPEAPWPAAPDDAEAATRWIAENGATFDRTFTHLVLCGDSAGGNLAAVAAMALRDRPARLPVLLQVLLYPKMDWATDYPSAAAFADGYGLDTANLELYSVHYRPDVRHWRASPVHGNHQDMPPTLLVTASLDPLRDEGRAYAACLIGAGVPTTYREFRGQIHGFATFRRAIPSAAPDVNIVLDIARNMIAEALTGQA
ncbi:MAG: alpha/beta hydrolase [Novosphingobium sp.]|nr:alpha/beta hydrolase [Novosphingobium sp.]